jgi:hypothetical protein
LGLREWLGNEDTFSRQSFLCRLAEHFAMVVPLLRSWRCGLYVYVCILLAATSASLSEFGRCGSAFGLSF